MRIVGFAGSLTITLLILLWILTWIKRHALRWKRGYLLVYLVGIYIAAALAGIPAVLTRTSSMGYFVALAFTELTVTGYHIRTSFQVGRSRRGFWGSRGKASSGP